MIVWGGFIGGFAQDDGGRYNRWHRQLDRDEHRQRALLSEPYHTAVWTGTRDDRLGRMG